jgi:hypothetical protein
MYVFAGIQECCLHSPLPFELQLITCPKGQRELPGMLVIVFPISLISERGCLCINKLPCQFSKVTTHASCAALGIKFFTWWCFVVKCSGSMSAGSAHHAKL